MRSNTIIGAILHIRVSDEPTTSLTKIHLLNINMRFQVQSVPSSNDLVFLSGWSGLPFHSKLDAWAFRRRSLGGYYS